MHVFWPTGHGMVADGSVVSGSQPTGCPREYNHYGLLLDFPFYISVLGPNLQMRLGRSFTREGH